MTARPLQRLGVLVCGQVPDLLAPRFGRYPDMFRQLLGRIAPALELVDYAVDAGEFPDDLQACDGYLITGSRRSVYEDEPWIRRLETCVRALYAERRPTVGVCFGHQMLGRALGGATQRASQGWGIGRHCMEVLAPAPWMTPAAARYALFVSHQDQVTTLPPGARRLASNAHCENAMFVLDDVMLGIQAHPEFESGYARALAQSRRDVIGADAVAAAMAGFDEPVDAELVARWMLAFLAQATAR